MKYTSGVGGLVLILIRRSIVMIVATFVVAPHPIVTPITVIILTTRFTFLRGSLVLIAPLIRSTCSKTSHKGLMNWALMILLEFHSLSIKDQL